MSRKTAYLEDSEKTIDIFGIIKNLYAEANDILWLYDFQKGMFYVSDNLKLSCGYDMDFSLDSFERLLKITYFKDRKILISMFDKLFSGKILKIQTNIRFVCNDGQIKLFEIRGNRSNYNDESSDSRIILSGVFSDINFRKKLENQLNFATYYDPLTELPNRSMFAYRTNVAISQGGNGSTAVVYLDIDNFKRINDLFGHHVGDETLKEIANIIKSKIDNRQILSRPSGDGFLLLIQNADNIESISSYIDKLLDLLNNPFMVCGLEIQLACSAGIAIYPDDGVTAEELIKNADSALYKAKVMGKNQWCLFDQSINTEIKRKTELENNLRNALSKDELYLVYQPLVCCNDYKLKGVEALLRWNSSVYGNVTPSEFIPLAEEIGLIGKIGNWVFEEACKQAKKWSENYNVKLPISVNISAVQLSGKNFMNTLLENLEKNQLSPELIKIEITESLLVENYKETSAILEKLRNAGIRISLDDFGTGYSSLKYLKELPLDSLKIDKSFIKNLANNNKEHAIVGSIINLAHALGLDVVAEGVETSEQLECLLKTKCNTVQGYYFSKPLLPEKIEENWIIKFLATSSG